MAEYNMKVREDVTPFLFPCQNCQSFRFHHIYEQPYGLAIRIPFTKTALASTHKGYHIVCAVCTTINGRVTPEDVRLLSANIMPRSIYTAYPAVHQFYTPGYVDQNKELLGAPDDHAFDAQVEACIRTYRLET